MEDGNKRGREYDNMLRRGEEKKSRVDEAKARRREDEQKRRREEEMKRVAKTTVHEEHADK